jgi:hypothetical protein
MKKTWREKWGLGWRLNCFFTYIGFTRVSVTLVFAEIGDQIKSEYGKNVEEKTK